MKKLLGLFFFCLVVLAACQLYRPSIPNPPVTAEIQAPPEVKAILQRRCYQCHSNEVKLPVLDNVAPAYWLVAHDVKEARAKLNFSEFGKVPKAQQGGLIFESLNFIQSGLMPLPRYLKAHRGAEVTPEELQTLRAWAATLAPPLAPPATEHVETVAEVKPEFNGITMPREYRDWRPISSTDQWDNGTIRQILGNDVALKAIKDGQVNPWPDGTKFAKVVWKTTAGEQDGVVAPSDIAVVEFMMRDSVKYKDTKGWGWARWLGNDLKPYGKDAHLSDSCLGCHQPVKDRDYVYTYPLKGQLP